MELDRVLGRGLVRGDQLRTADGIGSFRLGSEHVGVTADATMPEGLGSCRWDDEGVEGRRVPIVRDGVLTAFSLHARPPPRSAVALGRVHRADGFARQPIVRMTNVNLEPATRAASTT